MITAPKSPLSHLDRSGHPRMVDVSSKPETLRTALASGTVKLSDQAFAAVQASADGRSAGSGKGNVLVTAQLAGIMAAKKTSEIIPLCHQLPLTNVDVSVELDPAACQVRILARARAHSATGVEMEALTAVSAAALTVYDMCKAIDRTITISQIRLLEKTGGAGGDFHASP